MKTYFSKRHGEAIRAKKLPVSFSRSLRTSILRLLERFSDYGGWNSEENHTFDRAEEALKTFYGKPRLEAFDAADNRVPADFPALLHRGYPTEFLDAVEAWFDQEPKGEREAEREINDCLAMNQSPWRLVNGEAILINSEYLHVEVQARTLRLLKEGSAFGALEEYQNALSDLQAGETKDAVVKAHKSVESVMKTALSSDEHLTFGQLLSRLIESGMVPQYYQEFLVHFEKLALGAVKERNRPGTGHGQGLSQIEVPRSLAEFSINLAGAINLFIIERWTEARGKKGAGIPEPEEDDEIPF